MQDSFATRRKGRVLPPSVRALSIFTLFLALTAVAVVALYYFAIRSTPDEAVVVTAIRVQTPDGWSETPLTDADRGAGLLLKLENTDAQASFLARSVVARLDEGFSIEQLATDTEAAIERELDTAYGVSSGIIQFGESQAVEVLYRQPVQVEDEDPVTYQTRMVIIPTENQTFYLTLRAPASTFDSIAGDGDQIMQQVASAVASLI
jgi:hypothetical protein